MSYEVLSKDDKMDVSVLFDTVTISIHCGDDYKAQVMFDHIIEQLKAGDGLMIRMLQPPVPAST